MFDAHHDLLTIAYQAYITGDYSYLNKISYYFNDHNVKGAIANLYFMSIDEMNSELGVNYYKENVSVYEMFVKAKEVLDSFIPNAEFIYSIEGADFIKNEEELERLYDAGLDSLILCWNNESKYGSGNRSDKGLTPDGVKLINKAIDLGMGIDLSHANKNTFYDLIDVISKRKKDGSAVCCYASHSNSRKLCDVKRNLDDDQLKKIKEVGGLVGAVTVKDFIKEGDIDDTVDYRSLYLDHIEYLCQMLGSYNVMIASDDMQFLSDVVPYDGLLAVYDYSKIYKNLFFDLVSRFGVKTSYAISYNNLKEKIYNKIKNNRENSRRGVK